MTAQETLEYAKSSVDQVQRGIDFVQDKIDRADDLMVRADDLLLVVDDVSAAAGDVVARTRRCTRRGLIFGGVIAVGVIVAIVIIRKRGSERAPIESDETTESPS